MHRQRTIFRLAVLLCIFVAAEARGGERIPFSIEVRFPHQFQLDPNTTLFIQGYEFRGDLTLSIGPADTVRVSDGAMNVALWPRPLRPLELPTKEMLAPLYGESPYFQSLLEGDRESDWRQALERYETRQHEVRQLASDAYWAVRDRAPDDREGAVRAAIEAIGSCTDILDPPNGLAPSTGSDIRLYWQGLKIESEIFMISGGRYSRRDFRNEDRRLTREQAAERAGRLLTRLHKWRDHPLVYVFHPRGLHVMTDSLAEAAMEQVRRSRIGGARKGPIRELELGDILDRTKGEG